MIFVTLGDSNYYETVKMNVESIHRLHPDAIIVVGDIGFSTPQCDYLEQIATEVTKIKIDRRAHFLVRRSVKLPLILYALSEYREPVCYMDGDTVLIRKMDINIQNHDVVLTTRVSRHGRINTGVFIVNNSEFMVDWIVATSKHLVGVTDKTEMIDQASIYDIIGEKSRYAVKEVPCSQYNYTTVENGIPSDVRAVHLKMDRYKSMERLDEVRRAMR
ncbi:MAG: hypothetical protein ACOCTU_07345 [Bacteroidota bacterium]